MNHESEKIKYENRLNTVIDLTKEMISLIKNGPEDPKDIPMYVFMEIYQEINDNLTNVVVDVVKTDHS